MDVKLIRMITGEDLIAEIVDSGELGVQIKNPCIVILQAGESGRANISLTHWVPYADDKEFNLQANHVVFMAEPAADMLANYKSAFGGLIVPPKPSIVTA